MVWRLRVELLLLVCAGMAGWCTGLDYLAYAPQTARLGGNYTVLVTLRNVSSAINVTVTLGPARVSSLADSSQEVPRISQSAWVQSDTPTQFVLKVLQKYDPASLIIQGHDSSGRLSFWKQSDVTILAIEDERILIFLQTDKPLYKGGDTVKFRVLTVDSRLRPKVTPSLQIQISDKEGNIIRQYLNTTSLIAAGYFDGEVKLSNQPQLGIWKVKAHIPQTDNSATKEFTVDEYVLPRFDVVVKPPKYFVRTDTFFNLLIEAKYAYGEPVKGHLDLTVSNAAQGRFRFENSPSRNFKIDSLEANGRTEVNVSTALLLDPLQEYTKNDKLEIRVNFTEALTGISRNSTITFISIENYPYKLDIQTSSSEIFTPGFPFTLKFSVTGLDGLPLHSSTKKAKITIRYLDKRSSWGEDIGQSSVDQVQIAAWGHTNYTIYPPATARRLEFEVEYGEKEERLTLLGTESPSNSFIKVDLNTKGEIGVGDVVSFFVNTNNRQNESMQYIVTPQSDPIVFVSDTIDTLGKILKLDINVTDSMAPTSRIFVYYVRSDEEVVGGFLNFKVAGNRKNAGVNLQVESLLQKDVDYVQPGEEVSFRVDTTPFALVGFLAVDQNLLLLKSGNDIQKSDLDSALNNLGGSTGSDVKELSVADYLKNSRLIVLTNKKIPKSTERNPCDYSRPYGNYLNEDRSSRIQRPCLRPRWTARVHWNRPDYAADYSDTSDDIEPAVLGGRPMAAVLSRRPMAAIISGRPMVEKTAKTGSAATFEEKLVEPAKTRSDFRESFLFETAVTNSKGEVKLLRHVPEAIGSWQMTAFSLSQQTGLLVTSEATKLKVFKPFFISLSLPFNMIRGENLTVNVIVFNYMSIRQNVSVSLEIREADNRSFTSRSRILVPAGEGVSIFVPVVPKNVGLMFLTATAQSSVAADRMQWKLPILPEGVKKYFNQPVFVDLRNVSMMNNVVTLPQNPAGHVNGSDKVDVKVVGDILGPAINNLDSLVRLPTGCGEQNMALMAPNVIVLRYLTSSGKLNSKLERQLLGNIEVGYQRELTYKHDDHSYSAWGKSDRIGSTWLTAYVARVFAEAQEFVKIDDHVIKNALRYLITVQKEDGSFVENGQIVDKQLQGGAASGVSLTAFCLLAFLRGASNESVESQFGSATRKAIGYLEGQVDSVKDDPYTLSIVLYSLNSAKSPKGATVLQNMDSWSVQGAKESSTMVTPSTGNGLRREGKTDLQAARTVPETHNWSGYFNATKNVEASGYALLAYLALGQFSDAFPITQWLLSKQNSNGGFESTQDTVVGLSALAEFAGLTLGQNSPRMNITVQSDLGTKSPNLLMINPENAIVLQTIEINRKPRQVTLETTGSGTALVYVSWTYNVASTPEDVGFDVNVTTSSSKSELKLQICFRYTKEGSSSMAVLELNTLSGYQVDEEEMQKLMKGRDGIRKVEVEDKDTRVNIYFNELTAQATCLKISTHRIYKISDQKERSITVYDYYNPKDRKTVAYKL